MSSVKPSKEKHHWVPQAYLQRFTYNKRLTAEWISGPKKGQVFFPSTGSVCSERGMNDLSELDSVGFPGVKPRLFEDILGTIDNIYHRHATESLDKDIFPSRQQTSGFAFFVYHLLGRSPACRETTQKLMDQMDMADAEKQVLGVFGLRAFAVIMSTFQGYLDNAAYQVIKAPDSERFLSSDNPASRWIRYRGKLYLYNTSNWEKFYKGKFEDHVIYCPLSPKFFLKFSPRKRGGETVKYRVAKLDEVCKLNRRVTESAYQLLFR